MNKRITIAIAMISLLCYSCVSFTRLTHISSPIRIKGLPNAAKLVRIDLDSSWCIMANINEFVEYSNAIRDSISYYNINNRDNDTVRIVKAKVGEEMNGAMGKFIKSKIAQREGLLIYNYKKGKRIHYFRYKFFDLQPYPRCGSAGYAYCIKRTNIGIVERVIRRY